MKIQTRLLRKTALAAAVTLVIGGVASMSSFMGIETGMSSIVSTAYAAKGDGQGAMGAGGQGGQGGQAAGGQGQRGGGQGQRGGKSVADVLADEADDDSDRPAWAGVPGNEGKPGGGNAGGDTKKGGDYGDLFVVLRDADGNPVTADGNEVYVLLSDGTVVKTVDGEVPAEYLALAQPVEFGRMNIARSPASVLEHSLTEALSKLDGLTIDADTIAALTDASGRLLTADGLTIDSPLENLALYEALLTAVPNVDGMLVVSATSSHDGADTTYTLLVDPAVRLDLAAAALAASSDKTGDLTADEIVLISSFMGVDDELANLVGTFTYDKLDAFANETVSILVLNDTTPEPDDYITVSGNVLDLIDTYGSDVFNTVYQPVVDDYNDGDVFATTTDLSGIYLFTQAADDSVQVLEFVHDSSAP